jgi:hypothetical protein
MMKVKNKIYTALVMLFIIAGCVNKKVAIESKKQDMVQTNSLGEGPQIVLKLKKGISFNHPSLSVWVEKTDSSYLQTLYISKSVATGTYDHISKSNGKWIAGEANYPAALPYWSHKSNFKNDKGQYYPTKSNPVPDAYTGATPLNSFELISKFDKAIDGKYIVLLEVNQTWDWNEYWTNSKFPDDADYKTSCQPSVVYAVEIDTRSSVKEYYLKAIGHGHYSGSDGKLYPDLSTLTTALHIYDEIKVVLP